jgi:hypothetical protein
LQPRPEKVPCPLPVPRPTRLLACLEPGAGEILSCLTNLLLHFDQMSYLVDHAAYGVCILAYDTLIQTVKTQSLQGLPLGFIITYGAFYPGYT